MSTLLLWASYNSSSAFPVFGVVVLWVVTHPHALRVTDHVVMPCSIDAMLLSRLALFVCYHSVNGVYEETQIL